MKMRPVGRMSEYLHNDPVLQSISAYLKEIGTMVLREKAVMKPERRTKK